MRLVSLMLALLVVEAAAFAQASTVTGSAEAASGRQSSQQSADSADAQAGEVRPSQTADSPAVFEHPATTRFWLSGQSNIVFQYHPSFPAKYTGVNSMLPVAQHATSRVFTLYTGYELNSTTEFIFDVESAEQLHAAISSLPFFPFLSVDVTPLVPHPSSINPEDNPLLKEGKA